MANKEINLTQKNKNEKLEKENAFLSGKQAEKMEQISEQIRKNNSLYDELRIQISLLKLNQENLKENARSKLHTITIFSFILIFSLTILNNIIIQRLDKFKISYVNGEKILEPLYTGDSINTMIKYSFFYAFVGFATILIFFSFVDKLLNTQKKWERKEWFMLATSTALLVLFLLVLKILI